MPPRLAFTTLGCKVNRVEAEQIAAEALACGGSFCEEGDADVVVVTGCAVTAEASHKTRKAVRHALHLPGRPAVVVTGCLTDEDAEALSSLSERVVVELDKEAVGARVRAVAGLAPAPDVAALRTGEGFRTRALVKVQDGCDNRCAYCIVPETRGEPRSVPAGRVLEEVRALVDAGAREVVLTGINVGRYEDAGTSLADLIRMIAETGVARIRLTSIEPPDLTEHFLDAVSSIPAFVEHLHVPLQSGSAKTLEAMGRRYDPAGYERAIAAAREAIPGVAITTDVICGFPGESEADARESERFVERMGFAKVHVFRYSPRPGTPAAARMDHVPAEAVAERAARMRAIGEASRERFMVNQIGAVAEVLVETLDASGAHGTARNGCRTVVVGLAAAPGDLVLARVTGVEAGVLASVPTGSRPKA